MSTQITQEAHKVASNEIHNSFVVAPLNEVRGHYVQELLNSTTAALNQENEALKKRERELLEDHHTSKTALEETLHHFKQEFYKAEAAVAEMRALARGCYYNPDRTSGQALGVLKKIFSDYTLGTGWKSPSYVMELVQSLTDLYELVSRYASVPDEKYLRVTHAAQLIDGFIWPEEPALTQNHGGGDVQCPENPTTSSVPVSNPAPTSDPEAREEPECEHRHLKSEGPGREPYCEDCGQIV